MKKFMLIGAILIQPFLWSFAPEKLFYMGEMQCQYVHEDQPEPFGLFFMKRVSCPENNTMTDSCLLVSPDEGTFGFVHVSLLQDEPNEFIASNPDSEFIGEGELVGFPWKWTEWREHLEFDSDGSVAIDVENIELENGAIHSKAKIFFNESGDGNSRHFATFSAYLYPIDPTVVEVLLKSWEEDTVWDCTNF